jgi:spermidine synthase
MQDAGFTVVPYQNSIPSMGRWGWNLGVKQEVMNSETIKHNLLQLTFENVETRFINRDAMISMTHFGKGLFEREPTIQSNTEFNHILLKYYRKGDWEVY